MGLRKTGVHQDAIRTDVRRPTAPRSGGGSVVLRLFLIAVLAAAGAGLGLCAAGRTDLLAAVGIPFPGASPTAAPPATAPGSPQGTASTAPPAAATDIAATGAMTPCARDSGGSSPPRRPCSRSGSPAANRPDCPTSISARRRCAPREPAAPPPPTVAAAVPPPATRSATPPSKPAAPSATEPDEATTNKDRRASDREKLLGAFAEAQAATDAPATIRVESTPKLRVRLGDKVLGTTPLTVSLPPPGGSVEIELFDPAMGLSKTEQLDLKQGDNGVHKVVIAKGTLELKIQDGVAVTIDGKNAGTAPLDPVSLYEGRHQVQLSKGELKERRMLEIQGGQTEVLEFTFPEAE
jgi:hypothetical protein